LGTWPAQPPLPPPPPKSLSSLLRAPPVIPLPNSLSPALAVVALSPLARRRRPDPLLAADPRPR
jgi:hypothetical protein